MKTKTFDELICDNDRPSSGESLAEALEDLEGFKNGTLPLPLWLTREAAVKESQGLVDYWNNVVEEER